MTGTNPEQADTVPPLSDAEVDELREWTDSHRLTAQSDAILRLCATVDALQHKLATARRQRDERPAGRVVFEGNVAELEAALEDDGGLDLPSPGTEVAVVVVADDSGVDS